MAEDENKNINFVLEVEKYPCLSNKSLSSYSRKSEIQKDWDRRLLSEKTNLKKTTRVYLGSGT